MQAKRIIEQEHRSLAAVLHGMLYVVREIRYGGAAPDFELLPAFAKHGDQSFFTNERAGTTIFSLTYLRNRRRGDG